MQPDARPTGGRARPLLGHASGSLLLGLVFLVALMSANVASYMMKEEQSRIYLKFEPPHVGVLRAILRHDVATDSIDRAPSLFVAEAGSTDSAHVAFRSAPPAVARVGRPYLYRPRPSAQLTGYSLHCERVDGPWRESSAAVPNDSCREFGLSVDSTTGVVSGQPTQLGRFDMRLDAQVDAERRIHHSFTLFVDDRLLLLGADENGRDLFRRLILAARYTLVPGLIAILVGVVLGVVVGAFAGFYGGPVQRLLRTATTVLQSIPGLLLIFLAAAISGFNAYVVMAVVGVILLPETANGVRERVEFFRRRDFVEAARELGLRDRTILWKEIVWHNARSFVLTRVTNGFAFAILAEVTVSYMGFGDQNATSLGNLLRDGRTAWAAQLSSAPALTSLVGILIVVATFASLERGTLGLWARRR